MPQCKVLPDNKCEAQIVKKLEEKFRKRRPSVWDSDLIVELCLYWAEGYSGEAIGKKLGFFPKATFRDGGRSAVLAKVRRMRLEARSQRERMFWSRAMQSTETRARSFTKLRGHDIIASVATEN